MSTELRERAIAIGVLSVVVATVALLLPMARDQFWLGGQGHGTMLAQVTFWWAATLVRISTGAVSYNSSPAAVTTVWVLINVVLFLVGASVVALLVPSRAAWRWSLLALSLVTLVLLFVAPQATYGP